MGCGILRGEKIKSSGIAGIEIHNLRRRPSKSNKDIDTSRTKDNYALLDFGAQKLSERVRGRVKELTAGKKIRSDAVMLYDFVATGEHEQMAKLSPEQQRQFFRDTLDFMTALYGKENIMYATIHMDEKTPHMHLGLVPAFEGRLCAKKLFTPKSLRFLQDSFFYRVSKKYGFERGVIGSDKKHKNTLQYKADTLKNRVSELENQISDSEKQILELEKQIIKSEGLILDAENQILASEDEFSAIQNQIAEARKGIKKAEINGKEKENLEVIAAAIKNHPVEKGVFDSKIVAYKINPALATEVIRLARLGVGRADADERAKKAEEYAKNAEKRAKDAEKAAANEKLDADFLRDRCNALEQADRRSRKIIEAAGRRLAAYGDEKAQEACLRAEKTKDKEDWQRDWFWMSEIERDAEQNQLGEDLY